MNKLKFLYIGLLPIMLSGCQKEDSLNISNTNPFISTQIESNLQIIDNNEKFVDKLLQVVVTESKNNANGELLENTVDVMVNPILIEPNQHAEKRMPIELGEEVISVVKYDENTIVDFLDEEWLLVPGLNLHREMASYALTKEISYKNTSKDEAMKKTIEMINAVTKEYGYPIISQYATDITIETITGKNHLKVFDCGSFYVANFITNDESYKSISNVLLFISQEHYQDTAERVYQLISGLENDAQGLGIDLKILKESKVNGRIIKFGGYSSKQEPYNADSEQEKIGLNLMAMPAPEKEESNTIQDVNGESEMADSEDYKKNK